MTSDANDQPGQEQLPPESATPESPGAESPDPSAPPRRKILIGSQRDPAAYKPKPRRDWVPLGKSGKEKKRKGQRQSEAEERGPAESAPPAVTPSVEPMVVLAAMPETSAPGLFALLGCFFAAAACWLLGNLSRISRYMPAASRF